MKWGLGHRVSDWGSAACLLIIFGFLLLGGSLLFTQCARVVSLSGGAQDVQPPTLVRTNPVNRATHFTGKRIKLTFDEYVNLKDAQKEIYFSPPFRWPYGTTLQGRSLVFDIVDTLQSDVTYRLHLGAAIEDLTEKNPFRDTLFVFSTGATIDTHILHGTVRDALLHSPVKGVKVMLYRENDDSVVYKQLPNYVAVSDATGQFRFDNLPAGGRFKLFALEDANANYHYDQPQKERIAFCDSLLVPLPVGKDSLQTKLTLDLFSYFRPPLVITSAKRPTPDALQVVFSAPVGDTLALRTLEGGASPAFVAEHSFWGDTARFWFTDPSLVRKDSLYFTLRYSAGRLDTLRLGYKFTTPDRDSLGTLVPLRRRLSDSVLRISMLNVQKGLPAEDSVRVELSAAVAAVDASRLRLLPDSVGVSLVAERNHPRRFMLRAPWKPRRGYNLLAYPGAFVDALGRTNDTTVLHFNTLNPSQYAILHLSLLHFPQHALVQVLSGDGKNTLIRSVPVRPGQQRLDIPYLTPGSYTLRIVNDRNANGIWDTGNYLLHQQPEPVRYYRNEKGQSTLSLRVNWEYDVTVDYTTLEE